MDYARTVLKMPVPEVRAWSAHAADPSHGVGTEFIITDKIPGVPLRDRWLTLNDRQWMGVVDEAVELMNRFWQRPFSQIGSIFYKEDVPPALRDRPFYADGKAFEDASERFRIGPCVDLDIWRGKRAQIHNVDRGPCSLL